MTKQEIIEVICQEYSNLNSECILAFSSNAKIMHCKKGTLLVKEGQYANKVYFIVHGSARAYYLKDGKDITDWFAFENYFICALNSFFLSIPSPHYIEVMEDAMLLVLTKEQASAMSNQFHDFERLSNTIVTKTMLRLQERVVSLQFQSAEQKYVDILRSYPDITKRVPLTHIASYIGITLETLSRIRKKYS